MEYELTDLERIIVIDDLSEEIICTITEDEIVAEHGYALVLIPRRKSPTVSGGFRC